MPLVHLDAVDALDTQHLSARHVGILPVAATEAHGPHLPETTDCDIAEGHLRALRPHIASHIDAVVLPVQRIGFSLEHAGFEKTLTGEPGHLIGQWFAIAERLKRAGGRRLVIVSSHGGNTPVVDTVILKARAELGLLAVGTAWLRFGFPQGLHGETERRYGIHGGDVETSLMLHYCSEKVDMARAENFASNLERWDADARYLSAYGPHRFGWMSHDLNPEGVVGHASRASAEKGAAHAAHILKGFSGLLEEVAGFDLDRFTRKGGAP